MTAQLLYLVQRTVNALAVELEAALGVFCLELSRIKGSVGVFSYVVGIGYLFKTYGIVVVAAVSASGVAAGVYQYLALFLVWYLFEDIELVVKVVIENDSTSSYTLSGSVIRLQVELVSLKLG